MRRRETRCDRAHLRAGLLDGRSTRESTDDVVVARATIAFVEVVLWKNERSVKVGARRVRHARRKDADDRIRIAVEGHRTTDDAAVARESSSPERVAQHHDTRCSDRILARTKRAPDERSNTEQRIEVRAHRRHVESLRLAAAGERDSVVGQRCQCGERLRLATPVDEIERRRHLALPR